VSRSMQMTVTTPSNYEIAISLRPYGVPKRSTL
jgi:hypothetical protein